MSLVTWVKIYVASFFFIVAIAWIEPFKIFGNIAILELGCSAASSSFIKPVCWLIRGIVVLGIGGFILGLIWWIQDQGGQPRQMLVRRN